MTSGGRESLRKNMFSAVLFLMTTAVVLVVIKFMNWLPLTIQNETLRRYSSIEQARASLPGMQIHVPSYFPQTISWPPEHVFAQSKPFPWVLMKFNYRNSSREALLITQSMLNSFPDQMPGELDRITESAPYELRGRRSLLEVGMCKTGDRCSRISWREGDYRITVFMADAPFELIKIAESMLH